MQFHTFAPAFRHTANTPGITAGTPSSLAYELDAGNNVFICNNLNAEGEGHYAKGMRAGFTVE